MQYRQLGNSDLKLSALGFGCGAVGGILVKGQRQEMFAAVRRAVELGVTYFDTAALYADGVSETNLGISLKEVDAGAAIVGSKVRLLAEDLNDIEGAVRRSVESSLGRLQREQIDLIQLHNFIAEQRMPEKAWINSDDVSHVLQAFARLRDEGKVRFWGLNGLGDPIAVRACLGMELHSVQICLNLLNPTASVPAPPDFPFLDQVGLLNLAASRGVGVLAIRVLAGGALSGSSSRAAHAADDIKPIASGSSYEGDAALSRRFDFLVADGYAASPVEAAIRFAVGTRGVTSAVVGISTLEQLEDAAAFAALGPLSAAADARLRETWASLGKSYRG